jgi:hypothetical protein
MFACCKTDAAGEPIGPLFNRNELSNLVSYLKQPNNQGISHYLENIMIPNAPKTSNYEIFIQTTKITLSEPRPAKMKMTVTSWLVHYTGGSSK